MPDPGPGIYLRGMPDETPSSLDQVPVVLRRALVDGWLERNIAYAQERIRACYQKSDGERLRDWEVWRTFSEHARGELRTGKLDEWLSGRPPEPVSTIVLEPPPEGV